VGVDGGRLFDFKGTKRIAGDEVVDVPEVSPD
jgi:hypothetical protein